MPEYLSIQGMDYLRGQNAILRRSIAITRRELKDVSSELRELRLKNAALAHELSNATQASRGRAELIAGALGWKDYTFPRLLALCEAAAADNLPGPELYAALQAGK